MDSWNDQSLLDVHFTRTPLWRVQSIWLRIRCWFVQKKLNPGMLCRHLESKCALHPKAEHFCNDINKPSMVVYGQVFWGRHHNFLDRSASHWNLPPVASDLHTPAPNAGPTTVCVVVFLGGSGGERTNKCSWEHVVMWLYGTATAINIQ